MVSIGTPDPGMGAPKHAAQQAMAVPSRHCCSSSRGPEVQWLKKLHISCAVSNTSHLYNTHVLNFKVGKAQFTYIWSKGVNKPGSALPPWFMEILRDCALQSSIIHGKSCLTGNCPRKISKSHAFYFHTKTPKLNCPKGNNLAHLLHQYRTLFFPMSQTIVAAIC